MHVFDLKIKFISLESIPTKLLKTFDKALSKPLTS